MYTPDLNAQRGYYDDRWRHAPRANLLQLGRAVAILEGLHAVGQRHPRILELGCGTGWLSAILGCFGPTTGVDLSSVAIEQATRLYPGVEFIAGDMFSVPLPGDTFDVVVSVQVIEHLEDPTRFVSLIADVLRPGGHLLLITDNPWNIARWRSEELERFAGPPQPIQKRLTGAELRHLLNPRFRLTRLHTVLAGYGDRGVLRVAHSVRLARLLTNLGLLGPFHRALLSAGFGLLIFVHGQRRW